MVLGEHHAWTAAHSATVVGLAIRVARSLAVPAGVQSEVELAALLHDIGKVGLPTALLEKTERLNTREWQMVRRHSEFGERLVGAMPGLGFLGPAIRSAHERWDGLGYPDGLSGEQIPMASRIVFVCDSFDAMTTDRPYSKAMPQGGAMREIRRNAGTQFWPDAVEALTWTLGMRSFPQSAQP